MSDMGTLGGLSSIAYAINENDYIVGWSATAIQGVEHAFLWNSSDGMQDLHNLAVNLPTNVFLYNATAINNSNQIVGQYFQYKDFHDPATCWPSMYLWSQADGFKALGDLDEGIKPDYNGHRPFSINDNGQVVGYSLTNLQELHAFVWTKEEGIHDLNNLTVNLPVGTVLQGAYDINNLGQIVGQTSNGRAFLLTPQAINVPTPTAYPSIDKFSQAPDLWSNSLSFIKNNISSFSPDSQQFFNDNWKAFEKYLRKYGTKDRIRFWNYFCHDMFQNLGTVLSWGAIAADFGVSKEAGIHSLLKHISKEIGFNILDLDNDSLLRAYVGVLTNAHVPTNPYSFVLTSGSLFSNLYALQFEQIADDPPDPNFTEVFQCPIAITAPFNLPEVSSDMNNLLGQHVGATYSTYYYMLGLTTSINRYSNALAAGDAASTALQFEAFVAYLTLYDQSLFQQVELKKQFKQALINQGVPDVSYNKQVMLDIQNEINQNGLPPEVITAFKNAGLTDQQIADLKQTAIDYVFPESLPGSVYSSLSKVTDLLLQSSSWVPPNPGVFMLLMD
jgi:probable HAF family extracellular repeat protein